MCGVPQSNDQADSVQQLHVQQPSTYAKPEAARAVLGSCEPETCWASYKFEIKILIHCCILLDFLCELYYDARIHEHQVYVRVSLF
jgi:hypothetical protein